MNLRATLLAKARLPAVRRCISHGAGVRRSPAGLFAAFQIEQQLVVHELERVLAGQGEPAVTFPAPWSEWWEYGSCHGFAPTLTMRQCDGSSAKTWKTEAATGITRGTRTADSSTNTA